MRGFLIILCSALVLGCSVNFIKGNENNVSTIYDCDDDDSGITNRKCGPSGW